MIVSLFIAKKLQVPAFQMWGFTVFCDINWVSLDFRPLAGDFKVLEDISLNHNKQYSLFS